VRSVTGDGEVTGNRRGDGFLAPVDYSRRTRYRRPPAAYLRMQWIGPLLARLAWVPSYVAVLEVPGRKSGAIRRVTLVRVDWNAASYLVALAGESEWVRNVRAARGVVRVGTRRRLPAVLVEIPEEERPPIIRAYLLRAGRRPETRASVREARAYFGLAPDPSLEQIGAITGYYPVFRIDWAQTGSGSPPQLR